MRNKIERLVKENSETINTILSEETLASIEKAAKSIIASLKNGGKVLVFGNGGSAADSQHMAAELVGRFKKERKALPAIALTANTSTITALANDYGFDMSFKRQLDALGRKEDVAMCISTSGMSQNIVLAARRAGQMGLKTIALLGKDGGKVKELVENAIVVRSDDTPRIQEAHILVIHILCELVEDAFAE